VKGDMYEAKKGGFGVGIGGVWAVLLIHAIGCCGWCHSVIDSIEVVGMVHFNGQ